ncbi:interleukin-1 beta-like [Betta splendens]|uniref:Interleukin-1 n=1 Tax=Betta splendens TaxID=158456 RepID=A0A6P7NPE6_BETSP|nr:interleukin-1 beta-like [Betta splendens]
MECEMRSSVSMKWSHRMPTGLELEVSHQPLKMKHLVNIIIALERLKTSGSQSVLSTEFRDENLLHVVMESIIEEHLVTECESAPSNDFSSGVEYQCSINDTKKRSLVLSQDSLKLYAIMLQGGNEHRKVYLNMSTYIHPSPDREARPVTLRIKGTDLYLSCFKDDAEPTLHLEVVEDKSSLSTISPNSEEMRFLFYKHDTGLNVSTLMSARFPDWYISTGQSDNNPVEMCQETDNRYRTFTIQRQS